MPTYYVQDFTYTNPKTGKTGVSTMYGVEDAHNHAKAAAFTPGAISWLATNFHWPSASIVSGTFRSAQPAPAGGHLLTWKPASGTWS